MASLDAKRKQIVEEELNKFINEGDLEKITTKSDFCRVVNDIMIQINEKRGAIQMMKIPDKKKLLEEYKKIPDWKAASEEKKKEVISRIVKDMLKPENISVGRSAMEVVLFIFGVPICALLAKRFVPRGDRVSDDVVLPVVTSLTVAGLATAGRL